MIVATPQGQLGNRLFQAAHFLAASREVGFELWNPAFGEYARWFPALAGDMLCRPWRTNRVKIDRGIFCRGIDFLGSQISARFFKAVGGGVLDIRKSHDAIEEEFDLCGPGFVKQLEQSRFLIVKGWKFRSHDALKKHRKEIQRILRPSDRICDEVARGVSDAKSGGGLLIGVHVRRGDYAGWLGGKYFFDPENYVQWMREAVSLWPSKRVSFLVCSNEPVDSILNAQGLEALSGPGSAVADLYALAACDYIMGPPSTFTLWASYYGGVPLHMLESKDARLALESFTHHGRS